MSSTAIANTGLSNPAFIRAPNWVNASTLGASSAVTIPIPAGAQYVYLSANLDFFVKWGSTGVSTAGATTDGSASELIGYYSGGVGRNIGSTAGTTSISVMSTAGATLTQSWWTV